MGEAARVLQHPTPARARPALRIARPTSASILPLTSREGRKIDRVTAGSRSELAPLVQSLPREALVSLLPEREMDLIARAQDGEEKARQDLVVAHMRLIIAIAKMYAGQGVPLSDLVNEGVIGFYTAIEKFDQARGHRLSTYATWWVRQKIALAVKEQGPTIAVPVHVQEDRTKINKARVRLYKDLGHWPTTEELALELHQEPAWVRARDNIPEVTMWLGQFWDEEDEEGFDLAEPEPPMIENERQREGIREALARVIPRERDRQMLIHYFGLFGESTLTMEQIHREFHVSKVRVRQIIQFALERLREAAATDPEIEGLLRGV